MFRFTFPMRDYCIIHLSLGEQGKVLSPQLWYVLLVHVVYKRMLQSAWSYSKLQRFYGSSLVSQYISNAWQLNNTPKPWRPGERCTTSALVCTSCICGVKKNAAIGLVVLPFAEILWLIVCFAIHYLLHNTPKPKSLGVRCTTSGLVCTYCTRGVQKNAAIGLVVLQTAEILWLIICFAIHFLCVTIE